LTRLVERLEPLTLFRKAEITNDIKDGFWRMIESRRKASRTITAREMRRRLVARRNPKSKAKGRAK